MSKGIVNSEIGYNNNPNEFISDAVSYGGSSGSPVSPLRKFSRYSMGRR